MRTTYFQIRPHAAPGTIEDEDGRGAACCALFWDNLFSDQRLVKRLERLGYQVSLQSQLAAVAA